MSFGKVYPGDMMCGVNGYRIFQYDEEKTKVKDK